MIRTLLIIAGASFVLMLVAFGGAAALGGPELMRHGWTIDIGDEDSVQWSGPMAEADYEWTATDTLTIAAPADVVFTQGDEVSVHVRGPQDAIERLTFENGRLAFRDDRDGNDGFTIIGGRREALTVTITAPDVSRFIMEGFGDLTLNGIDQETLEIRVEGAGDIEATGRAGTLNLVIEGAGDADLENLTVQNADIQIEGAGSAEVRAVESANVVIEGVGDVDLVQRPARLTQDISGVGSIDVSGE